MSIQRGFQQFTRSHSSQGFTLLEMLIVVVILGVLAAIAAPSWTALSNRQRLGTAQAQLFDVLRTAQAEARQTKTPREVRFDLASDPPRLAIVGCPDSGRSDEANSNRNCSNNTTVVANASISTWQTLGNGSIGRGFLRYFPSNTGTASLVFDGYGTVVPSSTKPAASNALFKVGVRISGASSPARCVIVQTLLGGMRDGSGADCN